MNRTYIHQLADWPKFKWQPEVTGVSSEVRLHQGALLGRMHEYGFQAQKQATLDVIAEETIQSSAIEGVVLNRESVRSSLARRLGLEAGGLRKEDRNVEGVVQMMLDATQKYAEPLTAERLCSWHGDLFPGVRTSADKFRVGAWRDGASGTMQVVSGVMGKEQVHYEAPSSDLVEKEMTRFFSWFNSDEQPDPLLKVAIAQLWFVTIHPFEDGNGRIARAIAELCLARSDNSEQRFYSMSSQIMAERTDYYWNLEQTQKGSLDITEWLIWFLKCLDRAINKASTITNSALRVELFWRTLKQKNVEVNDRQKKMLKKLLLGLEGKLTSEKWAKMTKVSQPTAWRDVQELIHAGVLERGEGGSKNTSFSLKEGA